MPELLTDSRALTRPSHAWRRVRARNRRCLSCGIPSPRAWTCAGCRWLDAQDTARARDWDEIDPERNDLDTSRELPWTVQGVLSVEISYQQALSPEDIQLRLEQARAEEKREREWQTRRQVLADERKVEAARAHTRAQHLAAERRRRTLTAAYTLTLRVESMPAARGLALVHRSGMGGISADGEFYVHAGPGPNGQCLTPVGASVCTCGRDSLAWTGPGTRIDGAP